MAPQITLISKLTPARPYYCKLHIPHDTPPTKHELHIELGESFLSGEESRSKNPAFLEDIEAAVAQGEVDAVVMYDEELTNPRKVWKALEGATPWHLEMGAGFSETIDYGSLKYLTKPWPLRSVYIGSCDGLGAVRQMGVEEGEAEAEAEGGDEEAEEKEEEEGEEEEYEERGGESEELEEGSEDEELEEAEEPWEDYNCSHIDSNFSDYSVDGRFTRKIKIRPSFPSCYSTIETLVLDCPTYSSLYFYPEGGAQNLRSLTICRNEAAKTFACTVLCNPTLIDTLRTVTVCRDHNPYARYDFEGEVMKRFFRNSKALRNVELVLSSGGISRYDSSTNAENEEYLFGRYQELCPYLGLHTCLPPTFGVPLPYLPR
ncbi:hypothetical protein NMY22_g18935 [Coprinellus aureogranulatus]|nr:hypothetical protein NMY22_g18935 [Coprinellus aureogranulatus]